MRPSRVSVLGLVAAVATVSAAEPVRADPSNHWSFRPLRRPVVPPSAAANPIDAFIRARLAGQGLTPAPAADKRTLLRRVTLDLTGLPPTPAAIDAFLADPSPYAYETVVDQLLASPAYGERQARLWMDLVHYAETHGHDQDRVRPNAWRYRDYLIAAFNADTPYGRFVGEQLAADVLYPNHPDLTPALGMMAAGPWDESSLRDIREDSIDRQVGYYLDRDDMVTTALSTFASLTVHCARCHDHKFDPITQTDYYRLQAVFAGVGRADRAYDPDPTVAKKRREVTDAVATLDRNDPAVLARFDGPALAAEVRAWEAKLRGAAEHWQPLSAVLSAASKDGATLTVLPDGSVRSEGKRPERDTYTVTARMALRRVTGLRLELLTDDALPHRGPGRQDNGNLHLSEIAVAVRPAGSKTPPARVALGIPTADFDQQGWTVRHTTDGNLTTAWGIHPQVGKPHEAVFPFTSPVGEGGDVELTVTLVQLHGGGHLIGRFRLSVTAADQPARVAVVPAAVADILRVPDVERTPAQRDQLALAYLKEKLTAEFAALPAPQTVYAVAARFAPDGGHKPTPTPRPVRVLKRGDIRRPGAEVGPGAVVSVPGLNAVFDLPAGHAEGERRAALAAWLTDPNNPLTWRSIVNRAWQQHFGRGLVDTPSDFGAMGGTPTHPELLDWLAADFRDSRQSLKLLHRVIVTSATYRQTSAHRPDAAAADADNRLLWRMPRARLDAEQVRDAVLLASGRLDRTPGGPSDQQFAMRPGTHVTPLVEYGLFDWDRPRGHRRSVYRFVFRTVPDPLVDCLDGANASQLTPARNESVSAPQSLSLLNNEFVLVHAKAMAADLETRAADTRARVEQAGVRLWGRPPAAHELDELTAYADGHGLANLCRVLFNSNEFLFAD